MRLISSAIFTIGFVLNFASISIAAIPEASDQGEINDSKIITEYNNEDREGSRDEFPEETEEGAPGPHSQD